MLFDIRDEDRAVYTLEELTGVEADYWFDERIKSVGRYDFTDADKDIERALRRYNGSIPSLDEIELIISSGAEVPNATIVKPINTFEI